jgi:ribonuclease VapC
VILDTSAIVAIALKEPGFEELLEKLAKAPNAGVGLPTLTETAIVLSARLKHDARGILSRFLMEGSIATVPFGDTHFAAAVEAWLRYGKRRHPASLNSGDCLSYATAALAGEPLLCVGDDFTHTDLPLA